MQLSQETYRGELPKDSQPQEHCEDPAGDMVDCWNRVNAQIHAVMHSPASEDACTHARGWACSCRADLELPLEPMFSDLPLVTQEGVNGHHEGRLCTDRRPEAVGRELQQPHEIDA